jgi:hypothetical protein
MSRAAALLFALACAGCQAPGSERYDKLPAVEVTGGPYDRTVLIKTRPGVRQGFSLILPQQPVAVALYFRGTAGIGPVRDINNDLPRNRVGIAIVDPPSDLPNGFVRRDRSGPDHVVDIDAVIRYVRQEVRVPVWLIGMSMGTVSAANVATAGTAGVDGVVFMAPVTALFQGRHAFGEPLVTAFALERIRVPVLAVSHRLDRCDVTPPSGAAEIARRTANAPVREAKLFEGGYELSLDPCVGNSHHTFAGIRPEVGDYVAGFIVKHSRAR